MGNITLKELARLSGLSVSSVSKALNDSHEISVETKERVRKLASTHNYRPNILGKSLKTGRSNTLAIVIPYLTNPFQAQILEGAHQAAYTHNYKLIFMQSRENAATEKELLIALKGQNIDGILMSPSANSEIDFLRKINEDIPVVLIDRIDLDMDTHKIGIDNERGAYLATQHLIDLGRKDILVLNGKNIGVAQKRISGYKKALLANYIDCNEKYLIDVDYGQSREHLVHNLRETLRPKLAALSHPIGLLGNTDTLTVTSLGILAELGIRVPEQVAVIGFSNTEAAESLNPSLSTIVQPAITMGQMGIDKLIHLITHKHRKQVAFELVSLDPVLVFRNSTKPTPAP